MQRGEWTLELRAPTPIRSNNALLGMPWQQSHRERSDWRQLAYTLARQAKLPTGLHRVRIEAELRFTTNRRRDETNYGDALKPVVDALGPDRLVKERGGFRREVGWGLIPDDTSVHLDGPRVTFGEPVDRRRYPFGLVVITITDRSAGADPAHHNGTGRDIGEWAGLELDLTEGSEHD